MTGILLFDNPLVLEQTDPAWDLELGLCLAHLRGAGKSVPDPEIRTWMFSNHYGVQASISREFLLAGLVYYNVASGIVGRQLNGSPRLRILTPEIIHDLHLPESIFSVRENLKPEEVEDYLHAVKSYRKPE